MLLAISLIENEGKDPYSSPYQVSLHRSYSLGILASLNFAVPHGLGTLDEAEGIVASTFYLVPFVYFVERGLSRIESCLCAPFLLYTSCLNVS